MNETAKNFYNKENNPEYYKKYEREHAPRLDFIVEHFKLNQVKNQTVAEFGCGYGFFLQRLDESNKKIGFDAAKIEPNQKLCNFVSHQGVDLDQEWTKNNFVIRHFDYQFDMSFCFETLEHLASPYNCLLNIKKMTKENAPIFLSIPDERVTHNVVYPALMFPHTNFEEFLLQMALPIEEHVVFEGDWPDRIWKCRNAPWTEKKLKYSKEEPKFRACTPLEATNL
jgi:2-polyprenyl-3-methyl-5-hydroxy-6-metoxy-1,4-benzoquinol methylase